ncbi:unnamed protein product [Closterium sp. NIES-53]
MPPTGSCFRAPAGPNWRGPSWRVSAGPCQTLLTSPCRPLPAPAPVSSKPSRAATAPAALLLLLHCCYCCTAATVATTAPLPTASTAPMASPIVLTFDSEGSAVDFDWTTRDAVARLAVRSYLPPAERAHFGQYKTAQSLYDAVVARYSSPATAALSRLMLPYHFPDLATFATVADLVAHLRTSDARYRAALPT